MTGRLMLGLAELEQVISEITYWPGWEFRPYLDDHLGPMVQIVTRQPDRDDPARTVDLGPRARIPPAALQNPREFCKWLLWRLEEAAVHEAREGLRYKGSLVSDPHASG